MDARERTAAGQKAGMVGIVCNVALVLAKGVAGILAGSVSVFADAMNNLMDVASSVVTLVGFKLASKPADEGHPYGHGRFEYLAGLAVAILVIITGVELVRTSIVRTLHPTPTDFSVLTLCVLALSIATKLALARYDRRMAAALDSETLNAAAQDSMSDVLATSAVLAGALLTRFAHLPADGPLGIVVGLFVLRGGNGLLRDTVNPLLGSMPDPALVERVRKRILSYPGVLGTHDLMIHDYGPGHRFASAHVEMAAEEDPLRTHEVIDRIERDLRETEGLATILHYDPIVTQDPYHKDVRDRLGQAVRRVDPRLTIHDARVANTDGHTAVAFDCVVPKDLTLSQGELLERIEQEVQASLGDVECTVTFDTGFVEQDTQR